MLGFVITTSIFLIVMLGTRFIIGAQDLEVNWEKQRCRPDVMITSALYGRDAAANIQFCLNKGFDIRAKGAVLPFYSIMGSFGDVLSTLIGSINSVKMTFATIVGSTNTVFGEFSSRIQNLFFRMQTSVIRLRFMFSRVFGAMHSVLYMGQAAIQAGMNFERSPLWNTISNFTCFDPSTKVLTAGRGLQEFKDLVIGDTLIDGQKITAIFRFNGDGQEMVVLPGDIIVSGPHRVLYNNAWIPASSHPDAVPRKAWDGGDTYPLMCINTSNYMIRIGDYTFTDYDETQEGNFDAMKVAMKMLNGPQVALQETKDQGSKSFLRALHHATPIRLKDGSPVPASSIRLGTELSHGTVRSIVKIKVHDVCEYKGEFFTPATAIWSEEENKYKRIGDIVASRTFPTGHIFYSFMVSPSAIIETGAGSIVRDYLEVHSREIESSYAEALEKSAQRLE